MRAKPSIAKKPAEHVVKDIRRATRRHFSAEDKIRIVLEGLRAMTVLLSSAARKVSPRACTTPGRRNSWKPGSAAWPVIPLVPPRPTRSMITAAKPAP